VFVFYCNYVNPACIAVIPNKRFSFFFIKFSYNPPPNRRFRWGRKKYDFQWASWNFWDINSYVLCNEVLWSVEWSQVENSIDKQCRVICRQSSFQFIERFTARRCCSAICAMALCPSVCHTQVGVLLKRLNRRGLCQQYHTVAQGLQFSYAKHLREIRPGSPPARALNAGFEFR